jgi:hypothetical protein
MNDFIRKPALKETLLSSIHQAITTEETGVLTNPDMDTETTIVDTSDLQLSPDRLDQMAEMIGQERLCALIRKLIAETELGYRKPRRSFLQARTGIPPGYSVSWREVQAHLAPNRFRWNYRQRKPQLFLAKHLKWRNSTGFNAFGPER